MDDLEKNNSENTPEKGEGARSGGLRASLEANLDKGQEGQQLTKESSKETKTIEAKTIKRSLRDNLEAKISPSGDSDTPSAGAEIPPVVQQTVVAPPPYLRAEHKEAFSKYPAEMQAEISRLLYEYQSDHSRKINGLKERETELEGIYKVITPEVRNSYVKKGVSVPQIVERALAWEQDFERDRVAAARDFLDAWGIDPQELINGSYQPADPQYLTREQAEQIAEERARKYFEEQQGQVLAEHNYRAVESFIKSNPLFHDPQTAQQAEEAIAQEIVGLQAQGIRAPAEQLLQMAYERVTKLHPVFSNLLNQANRKQEIVRTQQEAEKAKAASRTIKGSPGQGTPKIKAGSLREALERNLGS